MSPGRGWRKHPLMLIDRRTYLVGRVRVPLHVLTMMMLFAYGAYTSPATAAQRPQTKEYSITIDATALEPPTWWYVPGVTPLVWNLDPDSTEALKTTERHELQLKPGAYRFGTFTFDFPFSVTLEGKLDFAGTLDQCVSGRGTNELKVRCSKTQPYGGQPEYWGNKNGK